MMLFVWDNFKNTMISMAEIRRKKIQGIPEYFVWHPCIFFVVTVYRLEML